MKHFLTPLLILLWCITACQKLELPTQSGDKQTENKTDSDSDSDKTSTDSTGYYTVATLCQAADDDFVGLKCYIVGYMPGSSVKGTVFSAEDAVETNLVVADSVGTTDYAHCATVQLKKGTDAREDLNLCDHPELLHSLVLLFGTKSDYCYATGLKNVKEYEILEEGSDEDEDEDEDEEEDDTSTSHFPTLSEEQVEAFEGA